MGALSCVLVAVVVVAAASACSGGAPPEADAHPGKMQSDCVTCHLPEYQSAHHHVGEKPTTCFICHTSEAWHPTGLHHPWPLDGAHAKVNCFDCHKGEPAVFKGTSKKCAACHETEFDKAPDHTGHFQSTCEDCHTTTAWKPLVASPKWPPDPTPVATVTPAPSTTATTTKTSKPKQAPAPKPYKPPPTDVITHPSRR